LSGPRRRIVKILLGLNLRRGDQTCCQPRQHPPHAARESVMSSLQRTISLKEHGPAPHLMTPAHARERPECGRIPHRPPTGTHVGCQHGITLHRMQPFCGMMKKNNISETGIALTNRIISMFSFGASMDCAECQEGSGVTPCRV
jgi:hypothetical protein